MNTSKLLILFVLFFIGQIETYPVGWPPKWLDLPKDDYVHLLKVDPTPEFDIFHSLLNEYHAISKTDADALGIRIEKLDEISQLMERMKNDTTSTLFKKHLKSLITVSRNKSWYLRQLKEGYASGRLDLDYSIEIIRELTEIDSKNLNYPIIYLHHDNLFNPYVVEYWGDFWLEYIDPCHRKLWSYLELWQKKNSSIPFFLWLEDQNLSIDVPFVHYLSKKELSHCICDITKGSLFYHHNGKIVAEDGPADFLFCVNLHGEVLVIKPTPTIHHTSITLGKPVLAAGRLIVENGRIVYLSFESGHYLPSIEDGKSMILTMQKMGIDLPSTLKIGFFNSFGMHITDLQMFMDTDMQILETIEK